jgi:polyhydroxyalkanoate synthesis repressor PhaR
VKATKIVKRYQNRKLYDTEASTYVTLEDISKMIRDGEDVKVIDNKSKKDLTSVTLAQIIFEEQKKHREILPLAALRRIIQTGGESIQDFVEKHIIPGVETVQSARDELAQYIERLVTRGAIPADEGKNLLRNFLANSQKGIDEIQRLFDERVRQVVDRVRGYSSLQKEVAELEKKVAELETQLAQERKLRAEAAAKPRKRSGDGA